MTTVKKDYMINELINADGTMIDRNDNLELTEQTELNDTPVLTILQRDINMNKQYPIEELKFLLWLVDYIIRHLQFKKLETMVHINFSKMRLIRKIPIKA